MMRRFIASKMLDQFENRYDYDVSYMRHLLKYSPAAFFKFSKIMGLSQHHECAPVDALYAAKITGALAEDCGPCVQLVVRMAMEAGIENEQIEAVLQRDNSSMNEEIRVGFAFADAVIRRTADRDAARAAVLQRWGEQGLVDLTFAAQIGRIYPMIKAGLGYDKACSRVTVGDKPVDAVNVAA